MGFLSAVKLKSFSNASKAFQTARSVPNTMLQRNLTEIEALKTINNNLKHLKDKSKSNIDSSLCN